MNFKARASCVATYPIEFHFNKAEDEEEEA
jgi:hypothetical protein